MLSILPMRVMGLYLLLEIVHNKMDTIRTKFFWRGVNNNFRYHMMKWEAVTRSKEQGIRDYKYQGNEWMLSGTCTNSIPSTFTIFLKKLADHVILCSLLWTRVFFMNLNPLSLRFWDLHVSTCSPMTPSFLHHPSSPSALNNGSWKKLGLADLGWAPKEEV